MGHLLLSWTGGVEVETEGPVILVPTEARPNSVGRIPSASGSNACFTRKKLLLFRISADGSRSPPTVFSLSAWQRWGIKIDLPWPLNPSSPASVSQPVSQPGSYSVSHSVRFLHGDDRPTHERMEIESSTPQHNPREPTSIPTSFPFLPPPFSILVLVRTRHLADGCVLVERSQVSSVQK